MGTILRIQLADTHEGKCLVAEQGGQHRLLGEPGTLLSDLFALAGPPSLGPKVVVERLRSPLRPRKIIAVGLNYQDHVTETGMSPPVTPLLFAKFPSSIIDDGDPIEIDSSLTARVDWEVELAVVIGKRARHIERRDALDHVYGYTVANDVSARDIQLADGQWIRGKNLDTFLPMGSAVVTADSIPDPQNLRLGTRVNGEEVQYSSTGLMLFPVAEIIEFCSRNFTLEPGDVILTGTPWGCGEFMSPPRSLTPGDIVEVWVEDVGSLTNPVADTPCTSPWS